MAIIRFYDKYYIPCGKLAYSVIAARYYGKWIFVRHHDRVTWEICGGHIEAGESSDDAARRELTEETGALEYKLECIATYSVGKGGETGYGRLYWAEVTKLGDVPDNPEISERIILETLPDNLTYPDIQPDLFRRAIEFLTVSGMI